MHASVMGIVISIGFADIALAQERSAPDILPDPTGGLKITFIGHGSLILTCNGKVIHVDPYGKLADYSKLPKADLILITHEHPDHLDPAAIGMLRTTNTAVVLAAGCAGRIDDGIVMKHGEVRTVKELRIETVSAYNIVHQRDGVPYHPKGRGNGYILTFGARRVYVAGDTENTPEMKALTDIDVAFLPMNLPYTMTPEMVADAARAFKPKILHPYHYGATDPKLLAGLLKDSPWIELRIREMR